MTITPNDPVLEFYTKDQLKEVWKAATDSSYNEPFITAGNGGGLEAFTQGFLQLETVSKAIERTTQAMFILPHSSQTCEPASGGKKARVLMTVQRANDQNLPMVLTKGCVFFDEYANDYGPTGTQRIKTGRRYVIDQDLVFNPGESGPFTVEAEAIKIGYGYDYPYPNTIDTIFQPGTGFENEHGSIVIDPGSAQPVLIAANESDVPIPEHVGQYIEFVDGLNTGLITRIMSYTGPNLSATPPIGGQVRLETIFLFETTYTGTPIVGELVIQNNAKGRLLKVSDNGPTGYSRVCISVLEGSFELGAGLTITGDQSSAVFDCDDTLDPVIAIIYQTVYTQETGTASWRIRDWKAENEWGVTVFNEFSPSGGKAAMLDELGTERGIYRISGESDDTYRKRIARASDTITPNAVRRAINRVTVPFGFSATMREVGLELLPGFYFDVDAFDYDSSLNENDRFKMLFDYSDFRAFILVHVPKLGFGEFGWGFDDDPNGFFDSSNNAFFDGYPVEETSIYKQLFAAVDETKAGGVGFTLYRNE